MSVNALTKGIQFASGLVEQCAVILHFGKLELPRRGLSRQLSICIADMC